MKPRQPQEQFSSSNDTLRQMKSRRAKFPLFLSIVVAIIIMLNFWMSVPNTNNALLRGRLADDPNLAHQAFQFMQAQSTQSSSYINNNVNPQHGVIKMRERYDQYQNQIPNQNPMGLQTMKLGQQQQQQIPMANEVNIPQQVENPVRMQPQQVEKPVMMQRQNPELQNAVEEALKVEVMASYRGKEEEKKETLYETVQIEQDQEQPITETIAVDEPQQNNDIQFQNQNPSLQETLRIQKEMSMTSKAAQQEIRTLRDDKLKLFYSSENSESQQQQAEETATQGTSSENPLSKQISDAVQLQSVLHYNNDYDEFQHQIKNQILNVENLAQPKEEKIPTNNEIIQLQEGSKVAENGNQHNNLQQQQEEMVQIEEEIQNEMEKEALNKLNEQEEQTLIQSNQEQNMQQQQQVQVLQPTQQNDQKYMTESEKSMANLLSKIKSPLSTQKKLELNLSSQLKKISPAANTEKNVVQTASSSQQQQQQQQQQQKPIEGQVSQQGTTQMEVKVAPVTKVSPPPQQNGQNPMTESQKSMANLLSKMKIPSSTQEKMQINLSSTMNKIKPSGNADETVVQDANSSQEQQEQQQVETQKQITNLKVEEQKPGSNLFGKPQTDSMATPEAEEISVPKKQGISNLFSFAASTPVKEEKASTVTKDNTAITTGNQNESSPQVTATGTSLDLETQILKNLKDEMCSDDSARKKMDYEKCNFNEMINVIELYGGMCNALKFVVLGAIQSAEENRCFVVDESKSPLSFKHPNGTREAFIDTFFEPMGLNMQDSRVQKALMENRTVVREWKQFWFPLQTRRSYGTMHNIPNLDYPEPMEGHLLKRDIIHRVWRLLPNVRKDTCNSLVSHDLGDEYMAFSVRRGDKTEEKFSFTKLAEYIGAAENELYRFPSYMRDKTVPKIFVATDDCTVMATFREMRPGWTFISECDREKDKVDKGFALRDVHKWDRDEQAAHFGKFFVEIYALTFSKVYIGVAYTNVAWWVYFLRPFRHSFVLLDRKEGQKDNDIFDNW